MNRSHNIKIGTLIRTETPLVVIVMGAMCAVFLLMYIMPAVVNSRPIFGNTPHLSDVLHSKLSNDAQLSHDIYDFMEAYGLSQDDRLRYMRALTLQQDGWWRQADNYLSRVTDNVLLSYAQRERLLHPKYSPSERELLEWLEQNPQDIEKEKVIARTRALYPAAHIVQVQPANIVQPQAQSLTKDGIARQASYPYHPIVRAADMAQWRVAMTALGNKQYKVARNHAEAIIKRSGEKSPAAWWIAGISAWHQKDIAAAATYFSRMANCVVCKLPNEDFTAASFWAYRAHDALGDKSKSAQFLRAAAKHPNSFYGQIAEAVLLSSPVLNVEALSDLPTKQWNLASQDKHVRMIMALKAVGKTEDAKKLFYRVAAERADIQEVVQQLGQAQEFSLLQSDLAIHAKGNYAERRFANYPVPTWLNTVKPTQDKAFVLAIVRQESGFNPHASSKAGARGLMQIMPATAMSLMRSRVQEVRVASNDNQQAFAYAATLGRGLHHVGTNLKLGQKYIAQLAAMPFINNNLVFLAASYNAGPKPVQEWVKDSKNSDPLLFIESMPYGETRGYVKNILRNYWVYKALLEQDTQSALHIAQGEWPTLN